MKKLKRLLHPYKLFSGEGFVSLLLFPLFVFVVVYLISPQIVKVYWAEEVNKQLLSVVGCSYTGILLLGWLVSNSSIIFSKKKLLRAVIVFLAPCILITLQYSFNLAMNIRYSVLTLCVIYAIYKKEIYLPTLSMIILFGYGLLQQIGILWTINPDWNYLWILKYQTVFLIVPTVMCFFRPTRDEISIFTAILFKFALLILFWHIISYLFVVLHIGKNVFSCFQFDKGYLSPWSYHEVFRFTEYTHPSFLAWFFIIIGGIAYATWRQGERKLIHKSELFLYALLLLCFVFIVQARVGQLGFFIVLGFIVLLEISRKISKKQLIALIAFGLIGFLLVLYYIFTQTSFFSDPTRNLIFAHALESIQKYPFFGAGTLGEIAVIKNTQLSLDNFHHVHNDFVSTWIKHGIFGLIFMLGWIFLMFRNSFLSNDLRLFFFMLPTVLIMMTDSALFYERMLCITTTFLFMLFVPVKQQSRIFRKPLKEITPN